MEKHVEGFNIKAHYDNEYMVILQGIEALPWGALTRIRQQLYMMKVEILIISILSMMSYKRIFENKSEDYKGIIIIRIIRVLSHGIL